MSGEYKPFAPTPNRIARAKREGQAPRSNDLVGAAAFGCGFAGTACSLTFILASASAAIVVAARERTGWAVAGAAAEVCASAVIPSACAAVGALAAGVLDGGFRAKSLALQFRRLDPSAGLRRMFSRQSVLTGGRAAGAFGAAIAVLVPIGISVFAAATNRSDPAALASLAFDAAFRSCLAVLALSAAFAGIDRWWAHRRWLDELRMSRDELKRDLRETDGDPHTKGRRASLHRALVRGSIARVREAAFVVANPEHIAIALKYDPPLIPVPEILVRACDAAAQRVKALARTYGIPIVEDVTLARLLFAGGDAGDPIPRTLYVAVAQIVCALVHEGCLR
jgi:flagellar biosynthesis protein FlhB